MKKGFFKFLVIVLVFTMVQTVFASGSGEESSKGGGNKITVWCWDPNFNGYSMKEAAAVYSKMYPDVTFEIVDVPENIEGKIEAGLHAGGAGLPDIALFQDYVIEKFIQNYPGSFVDLKAAGIDFDKFAQYKVGPMSENGKVYGIPFDTGSTGFFLRSDMIRDAGLNPDDYIKEMTWKEIIKLGEMVKDKTGKPFIAYDSTSFDFLRIMVQSTGSQFFKSNGDVDFETAAIKQSLAILKEMNEKGLLFMSEGWNNWVSAFNNGETVGLMNALWIIGTLKSQPENSGKWMVVPTPKLEGIPGARSASNNGGSSWYVFKSSKNGDLAVDFLKKTWANEAPEALAFYNTILKGAGAMGTFLPSRSGSNYTAADDFFYKNQKVYSDFSKWMEQVPTLMYTANYVSMRDALRNAIQNMFYGDLSSVNEVIAAARTEYKQISGN